MAVQCPRCPVDAPKVDSIELLQPSDYHHHLRDEPVLEHTVAYAARAFHRLLVMPNLVPPVTTTAMALAYRDRILKCVPEDVPEGAFHPLMTLYLTDNTPPEEIERAQATGHIYAVKLYPAGATTNSDAGVTSYDKLIPTLKKMAELGVLLLVHGESTDQAVDVFEREQSFYANVMPMILEKVPNLKVVCEHLTSAAGVAFVKAHGSNVAGTITAHHLAFNRNAIFKGGIRPHYYCLPILKTEMDRQALVEAAINDPKFFLGTDSAPHAKGRKESSCGCAGCFTTHIAIELVAEAFEAEGRLDALEDFVSRRGAKFYGLAPSEGSRTLVRETVNVPKEYPFGPETVVPIRAGETVSWRLLSRGEKHSPEKPFRPPDRGETGA